MSALDNSFEKLLGRQPTDAEKIALYRVKNALDLEDDDVLWLLLMALQHYQTLYEKMPALIVEATKEVCAKAREAALAESSAATKNAEHQLMNAVATASQKVAHQVAGKVKTQWIVGCVVVVTVCLSGAGWFGYQTGDKNGWARGYQETVLEGKVAQWAVTPGGKLAYALAQAGAGNIERLANCEIKGWHKEEIEGRAACITGVDENGNRQGFYIPKP